MSTMKGVSVEKPGAPWTIVTGLPVPEPAEGQVLVKSISSAINPVETYMQSSGILVTQWPIILGCDASGTVVTSKSPLFQPGDRICGCTRLGIPGHSTFQEYFLMDADLAIRSPASLSYNEAAAIGVGAETACLGLLNGLHLDRSGGTSHEGRWEKKDTWVVVLGGAGSIGQYSIQIAKVLGYKCVASCSQRTSELVRAAGADAVIDYGLSEDEQLEELKRLTDGGKFFGVWDTVAKSETLGRRALSEVACLEGAAGYEQKVYATTDDWTPMEKYEDHRTYRVELGLNGRTLEEMSAARLEGASPDLNDRLREYVVWLGELLEKGMLKPNPLVVVKGKGFEGVLEGIEMQQKGTKSGEKVVVELQDS